MFFKNLDVVNNIQEPIYYFICGKYGVVLAEVSRTLAMQNNEIYCNFLLYF